MMLIELIKGDTGIGRRVTLSDENGPVDLTDAEITFKFGGFSIQPVKENETGKLLLAFESNHTEKTGLFSAAFKVRYKDGRKETFPGAEDERLFVKIAKY